MAKNCVIFHGTAGSPQHFWIPSITKKLLAAGWNVWAPQLPETDYPRLEPYLAFAASGWQYDNETVIVSHSSGCALSIALLEKINIKMKRTILVAGFIEPLTEVAQLMLKPESDPYQWEKIKGNAGEVYIINSDDDPWRCDTRQGNLLFEKLGGNLIIRHAQGHMGSESFNQPYREFPLLEQLINCE